MKIEIELTLGEIHEVVVEEMKEILRDPRFWTEKDLKAARRILKLYTPPTDREEVL